MAAVGQKVKQRTLEMKSEAHQSEFRSLLTSTFGQMTFHPYHPPVLEEIKSSYFMQLF